MNFKKRFNAFVAVVLAVMMTATSVFAAPSMAGVAMGAGEVVESEVAVEDTAVVSAESSALPEAVNGVITLTEDVELAKTFVVAEGTTLTIDLNGKTVTGTMNKSVGAVIQNEGTLTLKNGTIKSTANNGGSAVMNVGTITIQEVTLNGAPNADGGWPSYTVNNAGIMEIVDSYITSYHGAVSSYNNEAVVTLVNTDIDMSGIPGFTSHALYTYSDGKIVVNGGEIKNYATDQAASGASVINGNVEVLAGTFGGRVECYYGTPVIKGGKFDTNQAAAVKNYLAEGVKLLDDGSVVKMVAKIGAVEYDSLDAAFAAAVDEDTIEVYSDATPALASQRAITKASVIDLNGNTLTLMEDDLYFGTTKFMNGNIVVDPSVKPSTAVFWMFENQTLTFDNVEIVATGVTGTYLIGLDGNNSDLNLLNGSEILVENDAALDLDIVCVNVSTGNDIVINNSKINVTNLDGRVLFRGNYTISGNSELNLEGITKAGIRIEAGQTLDIKDKATVTIKGEPRDGGIHLTDATATMVVADTATVDATVNETYAAKIGDVKYATIDEAFSKATDGDKIVLYADVANVKATIENDIVLDLGTKTVTDAYIIVTGDVTIKNGSIKNTNEPYPLVVQNNGELTIDKVAIEASKSDRAIWVRSSGELVFNSGSILATKGANNTKTNLIAAIYTDTNTDVTINGGTITVDTPDNKAIGIFGNYTNANVTVNGGKISTSGKNYSYGINVDGDITVTGGEIVTNEKGYGYSSGIRYGDNYALVSATGDVTVTGGNITTNSYSGYIVNVGRTYSSNEQTVSIRGGTFANNLSEVEQTKGGHNAPALVWEGNDKPVTATITNGDFLGFSANLLRKNAKGTTLTVSGGVFDVNVNEDYLAEGFKLKDNGDGTYGVSEAPKGTLTYIYTRSNGFWGEGKSNAKESYVVKLYEGEDVIATASLNDLNDIINGEYKNVTWSIPFDGVTDEFWTVEWADNYPKYDMNPTKGELWVDGVKVAENVIKYSGADGVNKIVAIAETADGVKGYGKLADAIADSKEVASLASETAKIGKVNVVRNVNESISAIENVELKTNVAGGVAINNTSSDWIGFNNVKLGKGVTVKANKILVGLQDAQGNNLDVENVIEGTVDVATFYNAYDSKTVFQNGGNLKTSGMVVMRYNYEADSGIYIYGDGVDSTVEVSCGNTLGAYSGTLYAEDAVINANMIWLDYKKGTDEESDSYPVIDAEFKNSTVNVASEFRLYKDASLTLTGSDVTAGKVQVRQDATAEVHMYDNSVIKANSVENLSGAIINAVLATDGTVSFTRTLFGTGTETDPYLIKNLADLESFRNVVDEQRSDGTSQFAGKYFKLTADIDLAGINWNPIGSMSGDHGSFMGVFDGDGHTISNLYVEQEANGIGLFARTSGNAVIKNLNMHNVTLKGTSTDYRNSVNSYMGAVVGNSYASTKIENVHVTGTVNYSGNGYVGGISGHGYVVMDNVSVKAEGTIKGAFWCVGGILGYGAEGTTNITNAVVEGTGAGLTVTSAAGGLGAIIGMAEDNEGTQPISGANLSAKNVDVKTYVGAFGTAYANYALGYLYGGNETTIFSGTNTVEDVTITCSDGSKPAISDAVAEVDGVIYFGIKEAIAAIDGEGKNEVKLLRDLVITENDRAHNSGTYYDGIYYIGDKDLVLDLNGFSITQNGSVNDYLLNFKNDGDRANTVTIKNGTIDAGTTAFCALCTSSSNAQTITIDLEDVTLNGNNSNGAVAKIRGGAVLNVKAGTTITGADNYVCIESVASEVNIYDGAELYQNGKTSYVGSLVGVSGNGTANVYGGYGESAQGAFIAMTSGGTINVYGGEWIADKTGTGKADNYSVLIAQSEKGADSVINTYGGTFTGKYNCYGMNGSVAGDAQLNIYGGKFSSNPKAYLAEGYQAFQDKNADNYWAVTKEWTIVVKADKDKVYEGEEFTVTITVDGENYANAGYDLTWDPKLFEFVSLTEDIDDMSVAAVDATAGKANDDVYTIEKTNIFTKDTAIGTYKFKAIAQDLNNVTGYFTLNADTAYANTYEIAPDYGKVKANVSKAAPVTIIHKTMKVNVLVDNTDVDPVDGKYTFDYDSKPHTAIVKVIEPASGAHDGIVYTVVDANGQTVELVGGVPTFTEVGEYTVTYVISGIKGYADLTGSFVVSVTEPEYVIEVVNNKFCAASADYIDGQTMILVYTNTDKSYFTYNGVEMFDVSAAKYDETTGKGYRYTEYAEDGSRSFSSATYKYIYALVVTAIEESEEPDYATRVQKYKDNVKFTSKKSEDRVITKNPPENVNADPAIDINDLTTVYGVYNAYEYYIKYYAEVLLKADVNNDKIVNVADANIVKAAAGIR